MTFYTFANATTSIPLANLDANFATPITLGNTAVTINGTFSSIGNLTLNNATIASGNSTVTKETVTTITSPAATNLTIQSAGTTAMTIDTSQNVGIGTASIENFGSTSRLLKVAGTASSGYGALLVNSGSKTVEILCNSDSNVLTIGSRSNDYFGFCTNDTERMRLDTSGRLLVNSTSVLGSGSGRLQAFGVSGSYVGASFYMNNNGNDDWIEFTQPSGISGRISKVAGVFTLTTVSDQRVKKDITDAPNALPIINNLQIREFLMDGQETRTIGLIAQEALNVLPSIVQTPKNLENEYYTVAYGNLIPYLIKSIQELKAEFDAYKASHP